MSDCFRENPSATFQPQPHPEGAQMASQMAYVGGATRWTRPHIFLAKVMRVLNSSEMLGVVTGFTVALLFGIVVGRK